MKKNLLKFGFISLSLMTIVLGGCNQSSSQGKQGEQGESGVSIVSITKTSSNGNIDVYTITYSDGTTSNFSITNGQNGHDGKTPYIGDNGNWWIGDEDTGVLAGEVVTPKEYTFDDFSKAVNESSPTRIVTHQTFELPNNEIILHYNSTLTIQYSDEILSRYDYSFEKLNEIVTGKEELVSVVSGTSYSSGSNVYDGVNWVNKADKAVTLSGVDLSKAENTRISNNKLEGTVSDIKGFFGVKYDITNFKFALFVDGRNIASVRLEYDTRIDSINENAHAVSYATFSYDEYTVNIPNQ